MDGKAANWEAIGAINVTNKVYMISYGTPMKGDALACPLGAWQSLAKKSPFSISAPRRSLFAHVAGSNGVKSSR